MNTMIQEKTLWPGRSTSDERPAKIARDRRRHEVKGKARRWIAANDDR